MNIPFSPEPQPFMQTGIGNAAIGGAPNRPFQVEQQQIYLPRYAEESYNFPRFNEYWKQLNKSTYNPVEPNQVNTTHMGNAPNGCNQPKGMGAGKRPMAWTPYEVSSLGVRGGTSQSNPYDRNSMTVEGSLKTVWKLGFNVNEGEPLDIAAGQQEIVSQLMQEMTDEVPVKKEEM